MRRAISAFNDLDSGSQRLFANHLADIFTEGAPLPALLSVEAEARDWASFASRAELKAYARACITRLPAQTRARLMNWAARLQSAGMAT